MENVIDEHKLEFLTKDLADALKWLCVGAVTWQAHPESTDHHYLRGLGMFTSFMQARALYEFFGKKTPSNRKAPLQAGDTAWAGDYTINPWQEPDSTLYTRYMANQTPAQKRVFHLVYCRSMSKYSGGNEIDETEDLKNQVVEFAKDLIQITRKFVQCVKPEFRHSAQSALDEALKVSQELADDLYKVPNPLS